MSVNKSQILQIFNKEIKLFLKNIIKCFPKEDSIRTFNTFILTFCKYNPVKLIEIWNYYIAIPYIDVIQAGDFNYFENKNYSDDLKDLKGNNEYILNSYNNLRLSISNLDKKNKLIAMQYVQILTKLSIIYFK